MSTAVLALTPIVAVTVAVIIVLNGGLKPVAGPSGAPSIERSATPAAEVRLPETRGSPATPDPSPTSDAAPSVAVLDVRDLRVSVPRLGIDLPLAVGEVARDVPRGDFAGATPEHVAFVYPGSSSPGAGGNTYIYAHARSGMFLTLWNAAIGDRVLITDTRTTVVRSYHIEVIAPRVDPTDTHWLDPSGIERVTLQTSTGSRPSDPRFIVVAYPDRQGPAKPSP